jgi:transcriptional regulator with XRE-family HTH domain
MKNGHLQETGVDDSDGLGVGQEGAARAVTPPHERVRRVRKALGLTQAQAAERAGVSRPWYSSFENGKEEGVKWLTLEAIARGLGFPEWHAVAALNLVDYERSRPAPDMRAMLELRAELDALRAVVERLRPPPPEDTNAKANTRYQAYQGAAAVSLSG